MYCLLSFCYLYVVFFYLKNNPLFRYQTYKKKNVVLILIRKLDMKRGICLKKYKVVGSSLSLHIVVGVFCLWYKQIQVKHFLTMIANYQIYKLVRLLFQTKSIKDNQKIIQLIILNYFQISNTHKNMINFSSFAF